jgi:beta-glucanase (GH16 family)
MKSSLGLVAGVLLIVLPVGPAFSFFDGFDGSSVDPVKWHIPTWVSPTDGTYIGRTQFRCTQNAVLPDIVKGNAVIRLDTFNPTGFSFYGTDLISNKSFVLGQGVIIRVRAKLNPKVPGMVGGIFLYALKPGSTTIHDEIDFEFLSSSPDKLNTNVYDNEPLGVGHPLAVPFASGTMNEYHIYEIRWLPAKIIWSVDGVIVRREKNRIPAGPMRLHLNIWAPAAEWPEAYSASLQPVDEAARNQSYSMKVDWVSVLKVPGG